MSKEYKDFLNGKIKIAEKTGFEIDISEVDPYLKPHQKEVVVWNVSGGCRADFLSFGLGKTIINLETAKQVLKKNPGKKALIVCPLGVKQEFYRDGKKIGIDHIEYLTNSSKVTDGQNYYITNYERIRKGDIDPNKFIYIGMDEASILRGLDTQTTDMIMSEFKSIPFRFVYTATPSPNRYLELTHYADYLGIMDRGQILTRFFQRDSTTAGNLTLFERREKEFWMWMSSWACFITKPSDLGYSDEGYNLPPLKINRHMVSFDRGVIKDRRDSQIKMYADSSKSLEAAAKEKRESLDVRVQKMQSILNKSKDDHFIIWHDLESERQAIQKSIGEKCKSVYGKQDYDQREKIIIDFSDGKIQYLSTKPSIAGSGCNFQYHCHRAIVMGINYKFNDFIQAIHRIYRFLQDKKCVIDIIFTDAEEAIMKELERKWRDHLKLQSEMTAIIRKFGLNSDLYRSDLSRDFFTDSKKYEGKKFIAINDDNIKAIKTFDDNSLGLICTSIPFGNHYEYSENYECFGHNETNEKFFKQMDFLTPELLRTLQPGRICAVHVKDRIRYSYMNGTGFTSIEPFSDHTNMHFLKHGFHSIGRVTITTDVVSENNQTYRLGWSEKCKDGSKMGVGLPEYVLLFRKAPTDSSNAYADLPVVHSKEDYTRARWQLDAHSYWKSNGERLADTEQLKRMEASGILKLWKELEFNQNYDFDQHEKICFELDKLGKLPTKYMAMPPISKNPDVWTDIVRMDTLNTEQSRRNATKHICPLQLGLIERVIERYSNPGEVVFDPFGGVMSVPYKAIKMGRRGIGVELNTEYYNDGVKHMRNAEINENSLTLFG